MRISPLLLELHTLGLLQIISNLEQRLLSFLCQRAQRARVMRKEQSFVYFVKFLFLEGSLIALCSVIALNAVSCEASSDKLDAETVFELADRLLECLVTLFVLVTVPEELFVVDAATMDLIVG